MRVFDKNKIFIGSFIVALLGVGLAGLLKSQIHHIEVDVNPGSWSRELSESVKKGIVNRMEPFKGRPILTVNLEDMVETVKLDRRIHDIRVQRKFPNRMELKVVLHKPLVLLMGLRGELLSVSRDARVFPPMGETVDLPILRGMNFHRKKELRAQALQMLEGIPTTGWAGRQSISEVRFDKKFGYVLYLLPRGVRVRLGQSGLVQKMSRVERVINYLENQNVRYRVIDARFLKKVVVKLRNDP